MIICESNTYSAGAVDECNSCGSGHSPPGSSKCYACAPGKYYDPYSSSDDQCSKCPAGRYSADGASSMNGCLECKSVGSYSEAGAAYCSTVGSGYRAKDDRSEQEKCGINSFSTGATDLCEPCPDGGHSNLGAAFCDYCSSGDYFDEPSNTCKKCSAGKYSEKGADSAAGCSTCADGYYNKEEGRGFCDPCPQYQITDPGSNHTDCQCSATFEVRTDTASSDSEKQCTCPPGTMLIDKECFLCDKGSFKSIYGTQACSHCDKVIPNSITNSTGASSTIDCICPEKTFLTKDFADQDFCDDIVIGIDDTAVGMTLETLDLLEGYWRTSTSSVDVRPCPQKSACVGGTDVDRYCAEGSAGHYCDICTSGYTRNMLGSCTKCKSVSSSKAVGSAFTAVAIVAMFPLGWLFWVKYLKKRKEIWKPFSKAIKIVFVTYQIMATLPTVVPNMPLPSNFLSFIRGFNFLNMNFLSLVRIGCVAKSFNFYHTLVTMTLFPLFLIAVAVTVGKLKPKHKVICYTIGLGISFVCLPSVTTVIFGTFPCDAFDDGTSWMRVDYSLSCDVPIHKFFMFYAVAMILTYPVGILALYSYLLFVDREKIMQPEEVRFENESLHTKSFLFDSYKPTYWWFEIFETTRRLMLTGALGCIAPGTFTQLVAGTFIAYFGTVIYAVHQPFMTSRDNILGVISNMQIFLIMVIAMMFKYQEASGDSKRHFNSSGMGFLMIIVCSLGVLSIFVFIFVRFFMSKTEEERAKLMTATSLKGVLSGSTFKRDLSFKRVNSGSVKSSLGSRTSSEKEIELSELGLDLDSIHRKDTGLFETYNPFSSSQAQGGAAATAGPAGNMGGFNRRPKSTGQRASVKFSNDALGADAAAGDNPELVRKASVGHWEQVTDPTTGAPYWFNTNTLQTSWTKPPDDDL